jgi:hypothetical protein
MFHAHVHRLIYCVINPLLDKHVVNAAALPLQQSCAFARALTTFGAEVSCDDPVILNRHIGPLGRISFTSRGPLNTDHMRNLRRDGLRVFNAEHDRPQTYKAAGFRQILTPAHIAQRDLRPSEQDRRTAMHPKWRNQLCKAEACNLTIRELAWDSAPQPLFTHAIALAQRRQYKPLPTALLAAFANLARNCALIFEAHDKGLMVTAILVLRHGPTATYQTAWTSAQGQICHAHNLLLFHSANRLATLGHQTFDLGLVETDHAATLARFKLRTGSRLHRLGGTWVAIPGL